MTTGAKTIKQKLFFSTMVLAFMWVIIGDLVTIHLEVYFGKKINTCWHNPLAKTHKDDNSTFKVKNHKSDSQSKHLDFDNETWVLSLFQSVGISINSIAHYFTAHPQPQRIFLRGPPSFI